MIGRRRPDEPDEEGHDAGNRSADRRGPFAHVLEAPMVEAISGHIRIEPDAIVGNGHQHAAVSRGHVDIGAAGGSWAEQRGECRPRRYR